MNLDQDLRILELINSKLDQLGQDKISHNSSTSSPDIQNTLPKNVHVGDIDIAYKSFGQGSPILLISGSGNVMDVWPSSTLQELSSNHTIIIFDNRGVGNTPLGTKPISVKPMANDTVGLLDALKIHKVDVLGFFIGSFVAEQLAITHPESQ